MAKKEKILVILSCTQCKRRNYTFKSGKKKDPSSKKLEIKKYCKFCKAHTLHKQTK